MFQEQVKTFLKEFTAINEIDLQSIHFDESDEKVCKIQIETTNNGFFIGKNGHTLKDIEIILKTIARNNKYDKKVQFNVGDYREKYEEKIKKMAMEKAEYVSKTGRVFAFPPMNSYERRLIHTTISESVLGILIKTESVGEGKDRHTVLRNK